MDDDDDARTNGWSQGVISWLVLSTTCPSYFVSVRDLTLPNHNSAVSLGFRQLCIMRSSLPAV